MRPSSVRSTFEKTGSPWMTGACCQRSSAAYDESSASSLSNIRGASGDSRAYSALCAAYRLRSLGR